MCEIFCKFFIFQRSNVSAQWVPTASVSVSLTLDFWNGNNHVYFIRSMVSTPRTVPINYKICIKIQQWVFLRKIHNVNWPTLWYVCHGFEQRIIDNATDEWCKRLWVCVHVKVFNLTADSTFVHFNVLVWWQLQELPCVECQFFTFMIFYIPQGSVAT